MAEADVLRVILSLVAVVVLLLGAAWLTRRAGLLRTGNTRAIQVIGMQNLGGRGYLALVQVEDTRLVLGITATNISLLHTLGGADTGVRAGAQTPGVSQTPEADDGVRARAQTPGVLTPGAPGTDVAAGGVGALAPTPVSPSHRFAQVLGKALKRR